MWDTQQTEAQIKTVLSNTFKVTKLNELCAALGN